MAMERMEEHAMQQDGNGDIFSLASATITVYDEGTLDLSSIYSDEGVTAKSNPFTAETSGRFFFYAANGVYDVKISKVGYDDYTLTEVKLEDPFGGAYVPSAGGTMTGLLVLSGDPTLALHATPAQAIQKGTMVYATIGGTDNYTVSYTPAPGALVTGMVFRGVVTNANTSTTPDLNIDSLGATTIVRPGGGALLVGDLPAGHLAYFWYDGVYMVLLNPATVKAHDHTGAAEGGSVGALGAASATDLTITGAAASPPDVNTITKESIVNAWINFDGSSGSIFAGATYFNVSGVTDNGTGRYTIIFDTDFADANYAVAGSAGQATEPRRVFGAESTGKAVGSVKVGVCVPSSDAFADAFVSVIAQGNQ